jgi:hypothetical protein
MDLMVSMISKTVLTKRGARPREGSYHEDQLPLGHQSPPHGQHLLLSPNGCPPSAAPALSAWGKECVKPCPYRPESPFYRPEMAPRRRLSSTERLAKMSSPSGT